MKTAKEQRPPALDEPVRYSGYFSGFGVSGATGAPVMPIAWNEVDVEQFVHIFVAADLPPTVLALQGRGRKLPPNGSGSPASEFDLGTGAMVSDGTFEFIVDHYTLDKATDYMLRASDDFANTDARFVITHGIRTLR